jgi:hypothetical protein
MHTLAPFFLLALAACPTTDTPQQKTDTGTLSNDTGSSTDDSGPSGVDRDGDGFTDDCDDNNPNVFPGAVEICDGLDNDCNNLVDDDPVDDVLWYVDDDADSYGNPDESQWACDQPEGWVANNLDCDDTSALFNPSAIESDCEDPTDYNCDGSVGYADADGDGYAACTECDDGDADVNPEAVETCNDADDDCDGDIDENPTDAPTWYGDSDGDGFGGQQFEAVECDPPAGYVDNADDCDDLEPLTYPSAAEVCDEADNDCDGTVDEGVGFTWYADTDGDGYGDASSSSTECFMPPGFSANGDDCDDSDPATNPGAYEVCDTLDNNCDGSVDENTALDVDTWYVDSDGDGYGDSSSTVSACDMPSGHSAMGGDCDDSDASSWPGADEICDSADNDCDGSIDEYALDRSTWYADSDADGYGSPYSATLSCDMPSGHVANNTDCNDNNGQVNPAATESWYDGVDSDCNGGSDYDADSDGSNHDGYGGGDCNDADASIHPAAAETWYDGVDSDCNGASDYDADADGTDSDSHGGTDCNDADPAIHFTAVETWYDGVDQNCNQDNDYDADADGDDSNAWGGIDCDDNDATSTTMATDADCDTTITADDCDDNDATSTTVATDADCDSTITAEDCDDNDATSTTVATDADCDTVLTAADCNDTDATISPLASEIWYDGTDQDCDGQSDYDQDQDGYDSANHGGQDQNDTDASCWDACADGSTQAFAGETCLSLANNYPNATDGTYWVDPDGDGNTSNAFQVYCEMSTEGRGWTLFAITDSSHCAEELAYGPNALTDTTGSAYITTALQDQAHTSFLQIFQANGSTTDFTIRYDFSSGSATVSNRFDSAVSSGEGVSWVVTHQGTTYNLSGNWRYSNGANTSGKWSGSGNNFANDDGCWGAANGTVDGNGGGNYLNSYSDSWGHENPNGGDDECQYYMVNGNRTSSSSIRNYMFYR